MASSEVDQKFLGKFAKAEEQTNPLLSSILFKILGLSINLSQHLVKARKQRNLEPTRPTESLDLYFHTIWLAREGLVMLEQYVIPMVNRHSELKVLAYKLRASFYHIFVLFHNQPPVSSQFMPTPESAAASTAPGPPPSKIDKGKGIASDDGSRGGPVAPPPGFGPEAVGAFLLPAGDYLPQARRYFEEAVVLADQHLWGSHSLRLSVRTEYSAFLYECVHDAEESRKVARMTINEVYEATEGIDNEMFNDACELVTVLGRMMKRGQPGSAKASSPGTSQRKTSPIMQQLTAAQQPLPPVTAAQPQPGFI
ncbi:hypothetical protein UCDDA912_g10250 [Diaporthe ampelina]|uniref:14-3-3 domain-containing protein n=1 Tax=Diaporthe ampelina TaxID=1214573 RepID=A0A0G2F4X8_9PEZI|nr:hypothetical protein UCDDA912_g10250 [Diaporthe ampelina]